MAKQNALRIIHQREDKNTTYSISLAILKELDSDGNDIIYFVILYADKLRMTTKKDTYTKSDYKIAIEKYIELCADLKSWQGIEAYVEEYNTVTEELSLDYINEQIIKEEI